MPNKRPEAASVDSGPISADLDGDGVVDTWEILAQELGEMSDKLAETQAENDRLKAGPDIDAVRARMLEPYVNKVFNFVAAYCAIVAALLIAHGIKCVGFALPETILAIISGSTAISVIGLIGLVITGLFGAKRR